ncbi:MAG: hypothetical protein CSA62_10835 [Planctomycetota bacterium]|nr:MAG: hypothetical protein CSA62_10835 [Planctomycetota bacterium]
MHLPEIQQLYDRGLFLQAAAALRERCADALPTDLPTCVLSLRTAGQLGCPRERLAIYRHLQKLWPESAAGVRFRVYELLDRGRLIEALELGLAHERFEGVGDEEHADWLQARADVYARLRDRDRAGALLEESRRYSKDHAWIDLCHAWHEWGDDQPEAALERGSKLLSEYPEFFWGYHLSAAIHFDLDQRQEALEVYQAADERFESPLIWYHHAQALRQIGQLQEARQRYQDFVQRSDWPKGSLGAAAKNELFGIAHELGEVEEAAARWDEASAAMRRQYEHFVPGKPGKRVHHKVPYVRQDELTCAPATLSAVLRFFGVDVPHDEVAGQISYSGTPDYRLHAFCKERGLVVRPFQFEPETAKRLIDLGLPFCLGTRGLETAHLQAIVGYDQALQVWLVREPGVHHWIEMKMDKLAEQCAARGAPCTLVAPPERLEELGEDPLPREREIQLMNDVFAGVEEHRFSEALAALQDLEGMDPGPWLWDAQRSVAAYVKDQERELAASRAQYEAFPKDEFARSMLMIGLLRSNRGDEVIEFAESCGGDYSRSPYLNQHLLGELGRRREYLDRARKLARRVCRSLPHNAQSYQQLADFLWQGGGERESALRCYRAATTLAKVEERFAWAYFAATLRMDRSKEGLSWLEQRVQRFGDKHAASRITLARAYAELRDESKQIEQIEAALDLPLGVDQAIHERIDLHVENDELAAALELLESRASKLSAASRIVRKSELLRLSHRVDEALELIDGPASEAPSSDYLQTELAACLEAKSGPGAVVERIRPLVERYPEHLGLSGLLGQALLQLSDSEALERFFSERVRSNPGDSLSVDRWMALLARSGRAQELLDFGKSIESRYGHCSWYWAQMSRGYHGIGDMERGREALLECLKLDPLHTGVQTDLIQYSQSPEEAVQSLRIIAAGFERERVDEASLFSFARLADESMEDAEVEQIFGRLAERFPEMHEIVEQSAEFLARRERGEEALAKIREARQRFPRACRAQLLEIRLENKFGDKDRALALATNYWEENPRVAGAAIELGALREERGEPERARQVYEKALEERPLAPVLHGCLADVLLRTAEPEDGLVELGRAIELDPYYSWARTTEINVLLHLRRYDEARERVETFVQLMADEEDAWQAKSNFHERLGEDEEAIEALRRALHCDPRLGDTRQRLVFMLVDAKRGEEAREVIAEGVQALGPIRDLSLLDAWVLRRLERDAEAREQIEQLLAEQPEYDNAWHMYLTWLLEDDDDAALDRLAENPPEALADLPRFHESVARSLSMRGQAKAAAEAARRWLVCDKAEEQARIYASWATREAGDASRADRILLEHPEPQTASSVFSANAFRAAVRQKEEELQLRFLRRVLELRVLDEDEAELLLEALESVGAKQRQACFDHFEKDEDPKVHDGLAFLRFLLGEHKAYAERFGQLDYAEDDGERAARMLDMARMAGEQSFIAKQLLPLLPTPVPGSHLWGSIGSTFCEWRVPKGARIVLRYMADDYRREDAEPWMIANLGYSYDELGDPRRCEEVCRYALALPRDHSELYLKPLLALSRIRQGDWSQAAELSSEFRREHAQPMLECLVIRMFLRLREAPESERAGIFRREFGRILRKADDTGTKGVGRSGLRRAVHRWMTGALIEHGLRWPGRLLRWGGLFRYLVERRCKRALLQ